jgi:hypothetical protein
MRVNTEQLSDLIHVLVLNDKLANLTLRLDRLKLNGKHLGPLLRAFIDEDRFGK